METFAELKEFAENPHFQEQKQNTLCDLTDEMIDAPLIDLINGFNSLPYCFTLQSCYGHFVYGNQKNTHSINPLPVKSDIANVEYRIAYIAFCIDNCLEGRDFFKALKEMTVIDPDNIQFCCAEWFWKRQVNSYALQVEPNRFKCKDTALFDFNEALYIEKIRNEFFIQLNKLLENELKNLYRLTSH